MGENGPWVGHLCPCDKFLVFFKIAELLVKNVEIILSFILKCHAKLQQVAF